jgi:hypothetical protein
MNARTSNSQPRSDDRISERAARRAIAQFRAAAPGGRDSRRASNPQILRRWALADLIADSIRRRALA